MKIKAVIQIIRKRRKTKRKKTKTKTKRKVQGIINIKMITFSMNKWYFFEKR